jgi:glucosamine kinase
MPVLVGVDAGGSSTEFLVEYADGRRVRFEGAAANARAGVESAAERLAAAIGAALDGERADAVAVGAAGAGNERVSAALRTALYARIDARAIVVVDDASIALRAAVPTGDGIVLLAGTGSIAAACIGEMRVRAGGYGYLAGDDGSGYAIGAAAVRYLLRTYDGRAVREPWCEAIETAFDARDAQTVLDALYDRPEPVVRIASLAPAMLRAAGAGERGAAKIVQAAALELFDLLKALLRLAEVPRERELPIVFAGGLFSGNSLLTYLVETRVSAEFPHLVPRKNPPPPADGALELARAAAAR